MNRIIGSASLLGKKPHDTDPTGQAAKVPKVQDSCNAPGCLLNHQQLNVLKTLTADKFIDQATKITELLKEVDTLKMKNWELGRLVEDEKKKVEKLERAIVEYVCPVCKLFYAPPQRAPLLLVCSHQTCSSCLPNQDHTDQRVQCPVCKLFIPLNTERLNWPLVQMLRRLYFSLERN
ncbi:hypothetical protein BgiBS90_016063 [Biomphalaria glabrata]|nr:hypothetical protein BgiBS90_016063 [Biomphalaria glabrata]